MTEDDQRPLLDLLLIEDNPSDIRLLTEVFKEAGVPTVMSVARDGEEAMMFLRRRGRFASAPRPALIVLDLNLPRKDGREVLAEIKRQCGVQFDPLLAALCWRPGVHEELIALGREEPHSDLQRLLRE